MFCVAGLIVHDSLIAIFAYRTFLNSDITKHVLKEHSKAFPKIIEKAGEKLEKVRIIVPMYIPTSFRKKQLT